MHNELLASVAKRASEYLDSIAGRRVWPTADAVAGLAAAGGALPEEPADPLEVLALIAFVALSRNVGTRTSILATLTTFAPSCSSLLEV